MGLLPKSKPWRALVSDLGDGGDAKNLPDIASKTLSALGHRYQELAYDKSVRESFLFLVGISNAAVAARDNVALQFDYSPYQLIGELSKRLQPVAGSLETKAITQRATADALTAWYLDKQRGTRDLFQQSSPGDVWETLGSGAGFCELSRLYFAKLTERYLTYFLDREASAALPSLAAREAFRRNLRTHVSEISQHAFETTKITQSYAAGWFNKYAKGGTPKTQQIAQFLRHAFEKMREEFLREARK